MLIHSRVSEGIEVLSKDAFTLPFGAGGRQRQPAGKEIRLAPFCQLPRTEAALEIDISIDYCENMKNITVSVDDQTYRAARIKAAEQDRSVSAVVKQFLTEFARGESEAVLLKRKEKALRAAVSSFQAASRLSRDELHERRG